VTRQLLSDMERRQKEAAAAGSEGAEEERDRLVGWALKRGAAWAELSGCWVQAKPQP
jgi:hypothetical protein